MKKALRIIIPILMVLLVLCSIVWYLFVYDRGLTQDILLWQARRLEGRNNRAAVWLYQLAYSRSGGSDSVAIELADQFKSTGNYTKAEYTLLNAIADNPSVDLYIALCRTYVEQDKLLDAVNMLDNVDNPVIRAELEALRPSAPTLSPEPGFYNQYITLSVQADGGTLYITTDGTYPSTGNAPYESEITLPAGGTTVKALTVAENGLVSPLSICDYTVVGVIEEITFQDSAIASAVRQMLNLGEETPIYSDDLWAITQFTVPEEAASYQDLANMLHLQTLSIPNGKSGDLSFLSSLQNLESLEISGVSLSSDAMAAIASPSSLQHLSLTDCGISDISPLGNLLNLKTLDLSNNSIRDLSSLSGLSMLEEIILPYNAVDSISCLASLPSLRKLDVSYNSLTSIASIGTCVNLEWLDISRNKVSDLTAVGNLSKLTYLGAAENNLSDVSPLARCLELKDLDISKNAITDISSLSVLIKLMNFNFSDNSVTALPVWPVDCGLITIDGSYNSLTSVDALKDLYYLNRVNMDYNPEIASIDALEGCPALIQVDVYGTQVTDVSALTARSIIVNFDPTSLSATAPSAEEP